MRVQQQRISSYLSRVRASVYPGFSRYPGPPTGPGSCRDIFRKVLGRCLSGVHPHWTCVVPARFISHYLGLLMLVPKKKKKMDMNGFWKYYTNSQLIWQLGCDIVVLRGVSQKVIEVPLTTPCPLGISAGGGGLWNPYKDDPGFFVLQEFMGFPIRYISFGLSYYIYSFN